MRLSIDNLDGKGAVDWTGQVAAQGPLRLVRTLNRPSRCTCVVLPRPDGTLPRRLARVVVAGDDGTVLFTGYVTLSPSAEYVGEAQQGSVYCYAITAESDEWLLDKQGRVFSGESFELGQGALLNELTTRVSAGRFAAATNEALLSGTRFSFAAAETWSQNVGALAGAAYASYHVLGGAIDLAPVGAVQRTMRVSDGTLVPSGLTMKDAREPANDVTVSGAMEAGAYVTEVFTGDGTTAVFTLAGAPFRGTSGVLVRDSFATAAVDSTVWQVSDPGSHMATGTAGLMLSGGNGQDGATTLAAMGAIELAGGLVLEANAVALTTGSDGVLLGTYSGLVSRPTCVAGFDVRSGSSGVTVQPLVNGATTGTAFGISSGHTYVLRIRLHATVMQRVRQTYRVMMDGVLQSFGGDSVAAPLSIVMEARDLGASSNTPVTVLYDGAITGSVASAIFAPVNAVQLLGSVGALAAQQTGSAWVVSQTSSGPVTRLLGTAGEGVDASLSSEGELRFSEGRVPAAGEQVFVHYRTRQRAVARRQNAAAVLTEAASGLPGLACWEGHLLAPVTLSSEDCANAAAALLAVSSDSAAALAGEYTCEVGGVPGGALWEAWPGDFLLPIGLPGTGSSGLPLTVRSVTMEDCGAAPEAVKVAVAFANDWADPLAFRLSNTLAADVAGTVAIWPATGVQVADLSGLTVVSVSSGAVQVDSGGDPPSGGGFEVRRRDAGFGPGQDAELVLRSPVRGFSVPRSAEVESFYIRMYDGSTPPVYSLRSAAVLTDVPVG